MTPASRINGTCGQPSVREGYNATMEGWVRRCSSFAEEADADREFWAGMTANERVAVVEQMRNEWWDRNGGRDEGLRRVVRVLRKAQR